MNKDRMFFDPYALAFIKAIVYFLCFLLTICLAEVKDKAYYLGVILYCLGCVGDYIENAFYKTEKCTSTRIASFFVAFTIIAVGLLSLGMFFDYNDRFDIIPILIKNDMYINFVLCLFWAFPTICGILLTIAHIRDTSNKNDSGLKVSSIGYFVKPQTTKKGQK